MAPLQTALAILNSADPSSALKVSAEEREGVVIVGAAGHGIAVLYTSSVATRVAFGTKLALIAGKASPLTEGTVLASGAKLDFQIDVSNILVDELVRFSNSASSGSEA
jgi:hypothetical protein